MTPNTRLAALCSTISLTLFAMPAHAETWGLSGGVEYAKGDYGAILDTELLSAPIAIKVSEGGFWARASVPFIKVTGPAGVIPGEGGVTQGVGCLVTGLLGGCAESAPADERTRISRSGVGDVDLSAGYATALGRSTFVGISGGVKLPTASQEKFLGTGTTDYTASGEIAQRIGKVTVSARGGRRFNGENAIYALEDVWLAGGNISAQATRNLSLGLGYAWREGFLETSPDQSQAVASASYRLSDGLAVQGYGYTGLTEGSPDIGAGLQLSYRIGAK